MHEYSLIAALLARIEVEARTHRATAVRTVTLRIGPLSGVERSLMATAFAHCRSGTLCENAELVITSDQACWRCGVCGEQIAAGTALVCPHCAMPARLAGGDELVLERLELEVPDHV